MTNEKALEDLSYVRAIAEQGAHTPLVGGRIGLMWGVLLSLTFLGQYLIMSGIAGLPASALAFLWVGFAVIGGLGSMILGRQVEQLPGAHSVANKVENYVWLMFAAMMGTLFIGIILKMLFSDGSVALYDFMVIAGFAGQGVAYGVVGHMSGLKWLRLAALAGFVASAVCFVAYGQVHLYLIAAIATVFTVILPSLKTLGAEPKNG